MPIGSESYIVYWVTRNFLRASIFGPFFIFAEKVLKIGLSFGAAYYSGEPRQSGQRQGDSTFFQPYLQRSVSRRFSLGITPLVLIIFHCVLGQSLKLPLVFRRHKNSLEAVIMGIVIPADRLHDALHIQDGFICQEIKKRPIEACK